MSKSVQAVPILVITGFLGSGKTTLLGNWIEYYKNNGYKAAVIMNELGDINLDGLMVGAEVPMAEMLSGCICCTISGDLGTTIMDLVNKEQPDVILIESTGAANPLEIIDVITDASLFDKIELHRVVSVVDAPHLLELQRKGGGKTYRLMQDQIRCADVILLNKLDKVNVSEQAELEQKVQDLNAKAALYGTVQCDIDLTIIETGRAISDVNQWRLYSQDADQYEHHSHDQKHQHSHHSHEHVMVYTHYLDGPVDSEKFWKFTKELPDSVFRAKGILRFTDTAKDSQFLFQYAYREPDFMRITPQKEVPDVLVFIGEHISKDEIRTALADMK